MSFHPDFREAPAARHVVKICRAERLAGFGGTALADAAQQRLNAGGAVTVEPVYRLGLCANRPAAMVDGKPMAAATEEKLVAEVAR